MEGGSKGERERERERERVGMMKYRLYCQVNKARIANKSVHNYN